MLGGGLKQLHRDEKDGLIARTSDVDSLRKEFKHELEMVCSSLAAQISTHASKLKADFDIAQQKVDGNRIFFQGELVELRKYAEECRDMCVSNTSAALNEFARLLHHQESSLSTLNVKLKQAFGDLHHDTASIRKELDEKDANLHRAIDAQRKVFEDLLARETGKIAEVQTAQLHEAKTLCRAAMDVAQQSLSQVVTQPVCATVTSVDSLMQVECSSEPNLELATRLKKYDNGLKEAQKRLNQCQERADALDAITLSLKREMEARFAAAEMSIDGVRQSTLEVASGFTKGVEWVLPCVIDRLRTSTSRSVFSPKFCASGESGLQLELQSMTGGGTETYERGNCIVCLWATKGAKLTFRLRIGAVFSGIVEHEFNNSDPYRSLPLWWLDEQIAEDGSICLGLEIIESTREVAMCGSDSEHTGGSGGTGAVGGNEKNDSLVLSRTLNNRLVEKVEAAVDCMRSHMLRRVEWRLHHASTLAGCYAQGHSIASAPFIAAGVEGLQLVFFPSGFSGARSGTCSCFLACQGRTLPPSLEAHIRIGKHRCDVVPVVDAPGLSGRINFARLEDCIDVASDALLIVLEVEKPACGVIDVSSHQAPWRSRQQQSATKAPSIVRPPRSGAVPASSSSVRPPSRDVSGKSALPALVSPTSATPPLHEASPKRRAGSMQRSPPIKCSIVPPPEDAVSTVVVSVSDDDWSSVPIDRVER